MKRLFVGILTVVLAAALSGTALAGGAVVEKAINVYVANVDNFCTPNVVEHLELDGSLVQITLPNGQKVYQSHLTSSDGSILQQIVAGPLPGGNIRFQELLITPGATGNDVFTGIVDSNFNFVSWTQYCRGPQS